MSDTCEHLAYEIDETTRIITVVYIGVLTDDEVLGFYTDLVRSRPEAPTHDYLLDMRYTDWKGSPTVIAAIDQLFDAVPAQEHCRRIAVVRKTAAANDRQQENLLRAGMNDRVIRYFTAMTGARDWLLTPL